MQATETLPALLEVTGEQLHEVVSLIQRRGGFVSRADLVGLSSYRLRIGWPTQVSMNSAELGNNSAGAERV